MQVNQLMQQHGMVSPMGKAANGEAVETGRQSGFGTYLKEAIGKVNDLQIKSDQVTASFAEGKKVDLHEVMIAGQKASISMQAALEIRNKVVEAYQEVMRMQV